MIAAADTAESDSRDSPIALFETIPVQFMGNWIAAGVPHRLGESGSNDAGSPALAGSGIGLMECWRLRAKDLGFDGRALIVRDGKGAQDRVTVPPDSST